MFERLLDMYLNSKITKSYLKKAVKAGWITEDEYNDILASKEALLVEQNSK